MKKEVSDEISKMLSTDQEKKEAKKPRAFVADSDLFDFSDVKIAMGDQTQKVTVAIEEKSVAVKK